MTRLLVSGHAVERYRERVRPALDLAGARRELETLLPFGWFGAKPGWKDYEREPDDRYLWLGDDVVLLVRDGCVITVFVSGPAPSFIAGRRFGRRVVRGAKRARNQTPNVVRRERKGEGPRRSLPDVEDVA